MHLDIKNIIDQQVNVQHVKPTVDDIVPYSCLFSYDSNGKLEHTSHSLCCTPRVKELYDILKSINIKNTSFLFYTHDYTRDYEDNNKYTLCFAKLSNQSFITIPNNHILNGLVDHFLNEVRLNDTDIDLKIKQSIFAGGPTGDIDGARSKYIFSNLDNKNHKIFISNFPTLNIKDQLKFLFVINIDGNGPCYDRLYWQLLSNSVPVFLERNKNIIQLHDILLIPNEHYVDCSISDWPNLFNDIDNLYNIYTIANNGQKFIKQHFGLSAKEKCIDIVKYTIDSISRKQNA